jgi:streptogramin lyase
LAAALVGLVAIGAVGAVVLPGDSGSAPGGAPAAPCRASLTAADPADSAVADAGGPPENARRTATVKVGLRPASLAAGREGVWVAQREGVALIDPATLQQGTPVIVVSPRPSGPTAPFSLTLARDRIWVARRDGVLVAIDRATRRVVGPRVRYGDGAATVALAGGAVWVNNYNDRYEGFLSRIDPCTGALTRVRVGRQANTVYAAHGSLWVSSSVDGAVFRVDPRSGRTTATIGGLSDPQDILAAAGQLWVTQYGARTVQRLDPRTNRAVGKPIRIGPDPAGLTSGAGAVWVPLYGNGTLTRLDLTTLRVRNAVADLGQSPTDAVVAFGRIWAPNNDGNTVTVVRP